MMTKAPPLPLSPAVSAIAALLLVLAVGFNGLLGMVNATITPLSGLHVAATEMLIAGVGTLLCLLYFRQVNRMWPAFLFLGAFAVVFLVMAAFNQNFFIKAIRDIYMIPLFFLLGGLIRERALVTALVWLTGLTLAVLLLEWFWTDGYVALFHPSSYYENTRGIPPQVFNKTGLFNNALGFEGRFTFGVFDTHRLSSIFLEQVSLGNFCAFLSLSLCAFWGKMKAWQKIMTALTIALILLTNESRSATALSVLFLAGYFIFPRLPAFSALFYFPLILTSAWLLFYDPNYNFADTVTGRIAHTMALLSEVGLRDAFLGNSDKIAVTADSGYTYALYSQTIFGVIALWLMVSLSIPQDDPGARRYAHGLALYIFFNLLIGPGVYSLKIAAPLWVIAGYFYQKPLRRAHGDEERMQIPLPRR